MTILLRKITILCNLVLSCHNFSLFVVMKRHDLPKRKKPRPRGTQLVQAGVMATVSSGGKAEVLPGLNGIHYPFLDLPTGIQGFGEMGRRCPNVNEYLIHVTTNF